MSYLARYRAGEHEAAWRELRKLSLSTGTEFAEEAQAVAKLLVARAHSNLQRIAEGLTKIGYDFCGDIAGNGTIKMSDAAANARAVAAGMLGDLDPHGLDLSHSQLIQAMALNLQSMADRASQPLAGFPALPAAPSKGVTRPLGDNGLSIEHVERFEAEVRPLPLVLAETWRSIGHADFLGTYKGKSTTGWLPLLLLPCIGLVDEHEEFAYDNESDDGFTVELAANPHDENCPLEVYLDPGVDARLLSGEWFVDHLRRATRSAGFLSLKEADMPAEIAAIARDWEPF